MTKKLTLRLRKRRAHLPVVDEVFVVVCAESPQKVHQALSLERVRILVDKAVNKLVNLQEAIGVTVQVLDRLPHELQFVGRVLRDQLLDDELFIYLGKALQLAVFLGFFDVLLDRNELVDATSLAVQFLREERLHVDQSLFDVLWVLLDVLVHLKSFPDGVHIGLG